MNSGFAVIVLEASLRAALAAFAVWTALRILRVRNVLAQKAAWVTVLGAALVMPLLMRWQGLPSWAAIKLSAPFLTTTAGVPSHAPALAADSISPANKPESTTAESVIDAGAISPAAEASTFEDQDSFNKGRAVVTKAAPTAERPATMGASENAANRVFAAAWVLYVSVCAVLLLRLFWGLGVSVWLRLAAKPAQIPAWLELPASIRVFSSARIASPVNVGSSILLPEDYREWDGEKLRVVLAHERSHIHQRDYYLQIAAGLYAAATWFSPLGWWLKHKLSELGEAISDRAGLDAATSPSAYAGLLLEFAALPRPTPLGVPMAHSSNVSRRVERLLNDASFRSTFSGGRRALAMMVVPVVLICAMALVRVEAATPQSDNGSQAAPASGQSQPSTSYTGQSNPNSGQPGDSGSAAAQPAPAPEPNPASAPAPGTDQAPSVAPVPPMPPTMVGPIPPIPPISVEVRVPPLFPEAPESYYTGDRFGYTSGIDYAIVGDPGTKARFSGRWDDERDTEVEKARSVAHGHFLLFRHEKTLYVVDNPAIVSQIESMDDAMDSLRDQMQALGKQMHEQGTQAREAAGKMRESAAKVQLPNLTEEMAALNAAVAELKAYQGGTVSREQLAHIQQKLGEVEGRLANIQVKVDVNLDIDPGMKQVWAAEGKLGQQMGQLGAQMGQAARENNQKIRSMIDESLKNGTAKPVN